MTNINGLRGGRSQYSSVAVLRYKALATHLLVGAACFYAGIGVGVRVGFIDCSEICKKQELRLAGMRGGDIGGGRNLDVEADTAVKCDDKEPKSTGRRLPTNVAQFAQGVSRL